MIRRAFLKMFGLSEKFQIGDTVTFAGQYIINPRTRRNLEEFVVTAVDGETLTIRPSVGQPDSTWGAAS